MTDTMFLYIIFLCFITQNVFSFNLDTNTPIVYTDPYNYLSFSSNKSSYFGYSLTLHPGNRRDSAWVLVGAPRGNIPLGNISNPGAIFNCNIGQPCQIITVDAGTQDASVINKLDGAWIGGSMDINYKYDRFVTCGPRWINHKKSVNAKNDDYRTLGSCYWSHINDNTIQKLIPLLDTRNEIYTDESSGISVYYYGQGQAGFSVHMPKEEREILIGAPGVFNWKGTSILYQDKNESPPVVSRFKLKKRYATPYEFNDKNIANAILTSQNSAYGLLGYSSVSGYFYNKSQLVYVSGAPRAQRYLGAVIIYKFAGITERPLDVKEAKQGSQFGEYFGGSLTAGDINGDGYDDLIVGAPYYKAKRFNEGRIYVFLGHKNRLQTPTEGNTINGKATNGQFGIALQYLGDLDHDGFGDVAVGAPYEHDNSGVVYIFKGSAKGLDITPSQKIIGRQIIPSIKGFGMSISRSADVDSNKYNDVAVGAYLSGHAVLLRTRPVAIIQHNLRSFLPQLDYTIKTFQMEACFSLKADFNENIEFTRTIKVDEQLGRALLENVKVTAKLKLTSERNTCFNFTVAIKDSTTNRYDPLTISLTHDLVTQNEVKVLLVTNTSAMEADRFCLRCPVYDKYRSSSIATVNIPFALGCGSDNICNTDLEIESKILQLGSDNTFVLGSRTYVELQSIIRNRGERAFLTEIVVTLPVFVNLRRIPSFCTEQNTSVVKCAVANPLEENSMKEVTLELDLGNVNTGRYGDSLSIGVSVDTSSVNSNNNVETVIMKLSREADITINGKSSEQSYSYGNSTQGKPNFTQIYQVEKFGISPVDEVRIEIEIPHSIQKEGQVFNFLTLQSPMGNLAGQPITCFSNFTYLVDTNGDGDSGLENNIGSLSEKRSKRAVDHPKTDQLEIKANRTFFINCSSPQVICSKIICTAGPFRSNQIAAIQLKMFADYSVIKGLLDKKDVILLTTHGYVFIQSPANFTQSGSLPDRVEVSTLFIGDIIEGKVETWIIIVSVIAGLLILLLVILGLIKAGFFKRKTKEDLEQLKKEYDEDNDQPKDEEKTLNSQSIDN